MRPDAEVVAEAEEDMNEVSVTKELNVERRECCRTI
jgi:hypothetical protein